MTENAHLAMRKTPLMFVPLNASTQLSVPGSPWSCVGLTSILAKRTHQSISVSELATRERDVSQVMGNVKGTQASCRESQVNGKWRLKLRADELGCRRNELAKLCLHLVHK